MARDWCPPPDPTQQAGPTTTAGHLSVTQRAKAEGGHSRPDHTGARRPAHMHRRAPAVGLGRTTPVRSTIHSSAASVSSEERSVGGVRNRWCNHLFSQRCPYSHGVGKADSCKFVHADAFATMLSAQRMALRMPNLMQKHMRALQKEMKRIADARARLALKTGEARQCGNGAVGPYGAITDALRGLGWQIPPAYQHEQAWERGSGVPLCDTPYAVDVTAIVNLVASQLHYSNRGSPEIMVATLRYIFSLDASARGRPAAAAGGGKALQQQKVPKQPLAGPEVMKIHSGLVIAKGATPQRVRAHTTLASHGRGPRGVNDAASDVSDTIPQLLEAEVEDHINGSGNGNSLPMTYVQRLPAPVHVMAVPSAPPGVMPMQAVQSVQHMPPAGYSNPMVIQIVQQQPPPPRETYVRYVTVPGAAAPDVLYRQ